MSDTPKVDAIKPGEDGAGGFFYRMTALARELEREKAKLRDALKQIRDSIIEMQLP